MGRRFVFVQPTRRREPQGKLGVVEMKWLPVVVGLSALRARGGDLAYVPTAPGKQREKGGSPTDRKC